MAIIVNLDVMMAKRKVNLANLSYFAFASPSSLSLLKNGKARAIRFSTLEHLCKYLNCQPGDILEYRDLKEERRKDELRERFWSKPKSENP